MIWTLTNTFVLHMGPSSTKQLEGEERKMLRIN